MLDEITGKEGRVEGAHNIQQIYDTVRSKIKIYGGSSTLKSFDEKTENLHTYIDEIFAKTKAAGKKDKMDFSRYPFDKKNENHFYVDQIGNVEIDLENFVERFTEIHEALESMTGFLYHVELKQDHL